jgi:hypothetical protein
MRILTHCGVKYSLKRRMKAPVGPVK